VKNGDLGAEFDPPNSKPKIHGKNPGSWMVGDGW
jgi:hypothetical protein